MFITQAQALEEVAAALAAEPAIALDTEFMRERTYRAELCLVQIASPRIAVCVDPIALPALEPLSQVLAQLSTVKVLHAARQDLEVLQPQCGSVDGVFDTQIAAGLAGFAAQVGYAELVAKLLSVELAKAHTRADWSKRPLSPEQIEYALDDVRYLLPLRERLLETLDKLGRIDWLTEELAGLVAPAGSSAAPENAWRRIKGLQGLDPPREALARSLAAWRERRAIERNRPRGWIVDDNVLREIIWRVPRTAAALAAVPEIAEGLLRNCGEELLALIAASAIPDPPAPLPRRARPDPEFTARIKRLAATVQSVALDLGIAPEVLATRRDLEDYARGAESSSVLNGWRARAIGDALRAAA